MFHVVSTSNQNHDNIVAIQRMVGQVWNEYFVEQKSIGIKP